MRCTSCGALLTSAEEQKRRIERYRESQKKPSPVGAIIKTIVFLVAIGAAWYFFSDQILSVIHKVLGRF